MGAVRKTEYYSFCGRDYACGDTLSVVSAREAAEALASALEFGTLNVDAYSRLFNTTSSNEFIGPPFESPPWWPVVGHAWNMEAFPNVKTFTQAFELQFPSGKPHNKFAIVATIRLLGAGNFRFPVGVPGGAADGWKYGNIRFRLFNNTNGAGQLLASFFNDQAAYAANIGPVPPGAVDYQSLDPFGFDLTKHIVITGDIDASLIQSGVGALGVFSADVEYPRQPSGAPWTGNQQNNGYFITAQPAAHPITGDQMLGDGVLDCKFYTWHE